MNSNELDRIRSALNKAHKAVEAEFNISISLGTITHYSTHFTTKMTATRNTQDGKKVTQESIDFKRLAHLYNLSPDDLNKTFIHKGEEFVITGLKSRNKTYPILAIKLSTGQSYKFPASVVKQQLSQHNNSNIVRFPG